MNITCNTVNGMTPQEKEQFFLHIEKRHAEEQEKINDEKARRLAYKAQLINDILEWRSDFTREALLKKDIRTLERIYDYC